MCISQSGQILSYILWYGPSEKQYIAIITLFLAGPWDAWDAHSKHTRMWNLEFDKLFNKTKQIRFVVLLMNRKHQLISILLLLLLHRRTTSIFVALVSCVFWQLSNEVDDDDEQNNTHRTKGNTMNTRSHSDIHRF